MPSRTHHTAVLLAISILLITAGCSTNSPTETPSNVNSGVNNTEITTTPSPSEEQRNVRTATVTRVIDGDTVEVRFTNGSEDTIRLLGVDTPETTYSRVSPSEYNGVPDTTAGRDHLFNWGEKAKEYAESTLSGTEVTVVMDAESDARGYYGRLLAYVVVDGENFNAALIENGYARVYESEFSKLQGFRNLQATAQEQKTGVWR